MQEQEKKTSPNVPPSSVPKPVKFVHEKGPQYRVYHGDGAWGVINNWGNLQIDFVVERPLMPSAVIQPVKPDGNFTGEQELMGVGDQQFFHVVRDFQCGVVLSLNAAIQVHAVLDHYIKSSKAQVEAAFAEMQKQP